MSRVAIVTDSASDLTPAAAAAGGITVVPLEVSFGEARFKAGVDLTTEEFWRRVTAPDAPFPKTAAASAGEFQTIFERLFSEGADAIVCVNVAGTLSGTMKSSTIARDALAGREIHVIDSGSASMGEGLLAQMASELAAAGRSAAEIAAVLEDRKADLNLYVALDTLEYLKRGGRISGAQAAIGTLLSVKPIITIKDGAVETVDKPRTRSRARERVIELLTERPVERIAMLHTMAEDIDGFRDELIRRVPGGIDPGLVSVQPVGPSVGPHLGPGGIGAVVLYAR
ncbi:MAG TPA: DegV family protein [Candidatus Limnocylindrales bacterium]